jgi:peptidoglycan hydrolase-like amidase
LEIVVHSQVIAAKVGGRSRKKGENEDSSYGCKFCNSLFHDCNSLSRLEEIENRKICAWYGLDEGFGLRWKVMKRILFFIGIFIWGGAFLWIRSVVGIDPVEELQRQIDELSHLRELSEAATAPLEKELENIEVRIKSIEGQLYDADQETDRIQRDVQTRELELKDQYGFLAQRVRRFYKYSRQATPLLSLLSTQTASDLTKQLSYWAALTARDRSSIVNTTETLLSLEEDQIALENRKIQLKAMRVDFEEDAVFFEGEIRGAKDYQKQLESKISELSKKQKEILAAKTGTFQTTVGDVSLSSDPASRPDYNPGFSPAYAAFSFGAPHYKGMSQYGALGRAKQGQSYEQIIKAYYGDVRIEKKDMPGNINTSIGSMPFEGQYLKGIAEMPSSWADQGGYEALKAQAIAARTYALSYVGWRISNQNASGSICTTENCQVYNTGKASDGAAAKWHQAVKDTEGMVVVGNGTGEIFATWYASTSGGYQESYTSLGHSTPAMWDTANGKDGWTSQAYEKIAGSPWFYKGWYKDRGGDSCGKSHPWLTDGEMADILNAWVVLVKHGEGDDRVTPIGGCWGGNPYSLNELRNKAASLSVGYSKVNSASVTYSNNGVTDSVTFGTDKGSVTIKGAEFKKAFNLRAPGKIAIKSGLFNIEKK